MKNFSELKEQEVLALAIALEEEDERTYDDYAHTLQANYPRALPQSSRPWREESGHRRRLIELYKGRFGEFIPMIRRTDVRGFMKRSSVWVGRPFGLDKIREQVEAMEMESMRFYRRAARQTKDASLRQLFDDLAAEERRHESKAESLVDEHLTPEVRAEEEQDAAPQAVSAANRAARARRPDGWFRLDAGADIRRGVCDASIARRFARRAG